MRRGTTPTFTFEIDLDITGWDAYFTFEQCGREVTHRGAAVTPTEGGCTAEVTLTQAETLAFHEGMARAQLRAVKDGTAVASTVFEFRVGGILLDGEIPQEA